ncbi:MAG: response regulator [Acidobacteriota bacterium]
MSTLHHVLVLEDHPDTAELYRELLCLEGYRVSVADTAQKAATVVVQDVPELLILDLDLPDQSGVEFLRTLRTNLPDLPVIVVTGSNRSTWRVMCEQLGVLTYFVKPAVEHLINVINLYFQSRPPQV